MKKSQGKPIFKEEKMRTRYFARVGSAALAALAATVFGTVLASAQSGAPVAGKHKKPAVTALSSRILQRTALLTSNSNISATCSTSGCTAATPVFLKNAVCPLPAGNTCTLYIHLESQDKVTTNDNGLFKFLVDGLPPNPGPTDGTGLFRWDLNDPDSGLINFEARSFAVVATVRNSSRGQGHSVEVDIACQDQTGDGCSASMGLASLNIAVYTP
jgi:hypothetical protein